MKFRYRGASMYSTFKPGETLYLRPQGRPIQPGDVIVYRKQDDYVVHRVTSVESDGIHTRGDDNLSHDEPVSPQNVIGVVEQAEDWGTLRTVQGGRKGLRQAQVRWYLKERFQRSLPWLGAPYRWLKAAGIIPRLWHPRVTKLHMLSAESEVVKYIVRGKTVATLDRSSGRFLCRRPYDLVIFPPSERK